MKIQVVLGLRNRSNPQVLIDGDYYITCMTGNTYFDSAAIIEVLINSKDAIIALRAAINAPVSDTKTDIIRSARIRVNYFLTSLGHKVEEVANHPDIPDIKRIEIAHSAGMDVKNQVHPQRHRFTVRNTGISGMLHLTAQGGARAHEWQYTNDIINFTGRIAITSTTIANTDVQNLEKGTEYAFFHKAITRKESGWEGPILCVVL